MLSVYKPTQKGDEMRTMTHKYKLTNMGESSAKYGPCEICGGEVSEVWHQSEERKTAQGALTTKDCHNLFGHRDCLIAERKDT